MNLKQFGAPNFNLRELVPPKLYEERGRSAIWHLNPVLLKVVQFTRDFLGKHYKQEISVIINDWKWGGEFTESGFRYPDTDTGSRLSFHKGGLCSAADLKCRYKSTKEWIPADDIRNIILNNEKKFLKKGLTAIEAKEFAPTWTHIDCRLTGLDHILIIKPGYQQKERDESVV